MMTLRATRGIAAGEEITASYKLIDYASDTLRESFDQWGFESDCFICIVEQADPNCVAVRRANVHLAREFVRSIYNPFNNTPTNAQVDEAKKLLSDIDKAYNLPCFGPGVPRLGLLAIGLWLMRAYDAREEYNRASLPAGHAAYMFITDILQVITMGTQVLGALGYVVKWGQGELSIAREHCIFHPVTPGLAAFLAKAYRATRISSSRVRWRVLPGNCQRSCLAARRCLMRRRLRRRWRGLGLRYSMLVWNEGRCVEGFGDFGTRFRGRIIVSRPQRECVRPKICTAN
jgi:hypothetical protein